MDCGCCWSIANTNHADFTDMIQQDIPLIDIEDDSIGRSSMVELIIDSILREFFLSIMAYADETARKLFNKYGGSTRDVYAMAVEEKVGCRG